MTKKKVEVNEDVLKNIIVDVYKRQAMVKSSMLLSANDFRSSTPLQ